MKARMAWLAISCAVAASAMSGLAAAQTTSTIFPNYFANLTDNSIAAMFARSAAMPFFGAGLLLLIFGVAAMVAHEARSKSPVLNGAIAALFGGTLIFIVDPVLLPVSILLGMYAVCAIGFGLYIALGKHHHHPQGQGSTE